MDGMSLASAFGRQVGVGLSVVRFFRALHQAGQLVGRHDSYVPQRDELLNGQPFFRPGALSVPPEVSPDAVSCPGRHLGSRSTHSRGIPAGTTCQPCSNSAGIRSFRSTALATLVIFPVSSMCLNIALISSGVCVPAIFASRSLARMGQPGSPMGVSTLGHVGFPCSSFSSSLPCCLFHCVWVWDTVRFSSPRRWGLRFSPRGHELQLLGGGLPLASTTRTVRSLPCSLMARSFPRKVLPDWDLPSR